MFLTEMREVLLSKEESEIIRAYLMEGKFEKSKGFDWKSRSGIFRQRVNYCWNERIKKSEELNEQGYLMDSPLTIKFDLTVQENIKTTQEVINWNWQVLVNHQLSGDEDGPECVIPENTWIYDQENDQLIFTCEDQVVLWYEGDPIEKLEWCSWLNKEEIRLYPNPLSQRINFKFQMKFQLTR